MPPRTELVSEEKLEFVRIGLMVVEGPLGEGRGIRGNHAPIRQRPADLDRLTGEPPFAVAGFCRTPHLVVELESIRQTDFELLCHSMTRLVFVIAPDVVTELRRHLPGRQDVAAGRDET